MRKELLDALKMIKEVCEKSNCKNCEIRDFCTKEFFTPEKWNIDIYKEDNSNE